MHCDIFMMVLVIVIVLQIYIFYYYFFSLFNIVNGECVILMTFWFIYLFCITMRVIYITVMRIGKDWLKCHKEKKKVQKLFLQNVKLMIMISHNIL